MTEAKNCQNPESCGAPCPVKDGTHQPAEALQQIAEPALQSLRERLQITRANLGHGNHWVEVRATVVEEAIALHYRQAARISELETQHREELRAYEITVANRDARIAELEGQLEAIGAGGVEPLRKPAAAPQAVQAAVPEAIEQMAVDRYKVVPSHESMFHRWAVVADNGAQQLYIGREGECQNMARKFMGAFLDGAFVAMQNATPAHPAEGVPAQAGPVGYVALAALTSRTHADDYAKCFATEAALLENYPAAKAIAVFDHAATQPAAQGMEAIRALIAQHSKELEHNHYAYFELAYTRRTGWMVWITDKPAFRESVLVNPDRKVLASGQGDTPEAACAAALAAQAKQGSA